MGSHSGCGSLELSEKEKSLLKNSWTDDFNQLYEIGSQVYYRIFELCPEIQKLFPFETQHSPGESEGSTIQNEKAFRAQALKFVQVLTRAANAYSVGGVRAHEFDVFLMELGHKHQEYKDRGFQPKYWDVFQKALCEIMCERMKKLEKEKMAQMPMADEDELEESEEKVEMGVRAWDKLSSHLIRKMNNGFLQSRNH